MRMNEPIEEKEYDENIYHPNNLNEKQLIAFTFVRNWIDAIERALAEAETLLAGGRNEKKRIPQEIGPQTQSGIGLGVSKQVFVKSDSGAHYYIKF